jgi:acyl carrier protein
VARHLTRTGRAEELLLLSRSGARAAGVAALAADVAEAGVGVKVTAADAADRDALAAVLKPVGNLTGVIHTAGVLDDGVISSLTDDRLDLVMRPKTDAAWNLHELTADAPLQEFVLFSSGAATFGSPGQGNYAAGNAFLDALAAQRQANGKPAKSLAWGLWADASAMTGHLNEQERQRNNRSVMTELTAEEGLALLDASLARPEALLVPAKVNVAGLRAQAARGGRLAPVWHGLAGRPAGPVASGDPEAGRLLRRQLNAVADPDRDRVLLNLVRTHGAAVLGHSSADAVGAQKAFNELGFDSLTALELRNRLNAATGLKLPATLVFDYPTPAVLSAHLKQQLVDGNDEQPDTGALALAEVGRLEEMVRAIAGGDGSRSALAARLKALVLDLETDPDPKAAGGADNDLRAATVENIFELLDNELAD